MQCPHFLLCQVMKKKFEIIRVNKNEDVPTMERMSAWCVGALERFERFFEESKPVYQFGSVLFYQL